ncbi:MAG: flagellar basal body rod protein FlgB [Oscillospiraceae bacterium]|nr:flagellar basal body rod protein FlgB [Oscillospiraceae bacterium]
MFNKMFRQIDLMQRGMDAAWMRQEVISHNIANVDTPGYKAQHVEFEVVLRAALAGEGTLEAAVTHPKHIRMGGVPDPTRAQPVTVTDNHYVIRMDGNNVDIDHEMNAMASNYIRYSTMQQQLNGEFGRLKMVIREGK